MQFKYSIRTLWTCWYILCVQHCWPLVDFLRTLHQFYVMWIQTPELFKTSQCLVVIIVVKASAVMQEPTVAGQWHVEIASERVSAVIGHTVHGKKVLLIDSLWLWSHWRAGFEVLQKRTLVVVMGAVDVKSAVCWPALSDWPSVQMYCQLVYMIAGVLCILYDLRCSVSFVQCSTARLYSYTQPRKPYSNRNVSGCIFSKKRAWFCSESAGFERNTHDHGSAFWRVGCTCGNHTRPACLRHPADKCCRFWMVVMNRLSKL